MGQKVKGYASNIGELRAQIKKHAKTDKTHQFAGALAVNGVNATPQSVSSTVIIPDNYNAVLFGPTVTIADTGTIIIGSGATLTIVENY